MVISFTFLKLIEFIFVRKKNDNIIEWGIICSDLSKSEFNLWLNIKLKINWNQKDSRDLSCNGIILMPPLHASTLRSAEWQDPRDDNWFTHAKETRRKETISRKGGGAIAIGWWGKKGKVAESVGSERRPRLLLEREGRAEWVRMKSIRPFPLRI